MGRPANVEQIRERAREIGLNETATDGFLEMDRDTLIVQAALWHQIALTHQNRRLNLETRSGEVIVSLLDLCREKGIEVPDAIYDAVDCVGDNAIDRRP